MGRRIDVVMTDSKTLFVPIADRPLLGVPEAEALTGVPAKIIGWRGEKQDPKEAGA